MRNRGNKIVFHVLRIILKFCKGFAHFFLHFPYSAEDKIFKSKKRLLEKGKESKKNFEKVYVELRFSITKSDCREYFMNTVGIADAKISSILQESEDTLTIIKAKQFIELNKIGE